MSKPIEDYALIGDTHTAALVGRDGAIDWLCMPRFDSGACFAALLGDEGNGCWTLAPAGETRATRRRYRGDTLILETEFETADGVAAVIDFMPFSQQDDRVELVRIVEGRKGVVRMSTRLTIRLDYGHIVPWVTRRDDGLRAVAGPDALSLRTPVRMRGENFTSAGAFTVSAGEHVPFTLTWNPSHHHEPPPRDPLRQLAETERGWQEWSARCTYQGEWREPVMRSLITLKALTYGPTGGIVAAPTTSLPEWPGSVRNWDYRYCWLRDATFALYALITSGYTEEAKAWRDWLMRAVAGKAQEMRIMYGIAGERRLTDLELPWLAGYQDSRPVRIGNAAHTQFQLDVYGEVMDSLHLDRKRGVALGQDVWNVQQVLMEFLETAWKKPDQGIWEVRGPHRHFTYSKVMAWVAFDRAVKAVEQFGLEGRVEQWRTQRDHVRAEVLSRSFHPRRNAFVQAYDSDELDAAVLLMPLVGFIRADDPRMVATVAAIQRELLHHGFVKRYASHESADGLPPGEGAFLPCTFWLADNLVLQGRVAEARDRFQQLLEIRNDVGLLAEEYDPERARQLGNFPQAFTHICVINTAHNLSAAGGAAQRRAAH